MPPNFSSQTYWEDRFRADSGSFDWLSSDASIFTSIIHDYTRSRSLSSTTTDTKTKTKAKTRVLHIGSGTSDLSFALRRGRDRTVDRENESGTLDLDITNVDYSQAAVEWGMDRERALFGDVCMRWETLDLLDGAAAWWRRGEEGQGQEEGLGMFDVVLDKSTADAMACGEPVKVSSSGPDADEAEVHPVEVLALNLARVVVPGGLWISLSYSAWRFDFLKDTRQGQGQGVGTLWGIERVENVEAKSGVEGTEKEGLVGVPVIEHRLYVLRRSDIVVGR